MLRKALLLLACFSTACSAPGEEGNPVDETIDSASQALSEGSVERFPGAITTRTLFGEDVMYIFACDSSHHLVWNDWSDSGGLGVNWERITTNAAYNCDGPPTVGRIRTTPRDVMAVYWRAGTKLVEAWFAADGTTTVSNLFDYISVPGFTGISGAPTVVDISDPKWLALAAKGTDGKLWSIEWYNNSYRVYPMLLTNGTQASGVNTAFSTNYDFFGSNTWAKEFVSMKTTSSKHTIFSRAGWNRSYTEYSTINFLSSAATPRALGFAGAPLAPNTPAVYYVSTLAPTKLRYATLPVASAPVALTFQTLPGYNPDFQGAPYGAAMGSDFNLLAGTVPNGGGLGIYMDTDDINHVTYEIDTAHPTSSAIFLRGGPFLTSPNEAPYGVFSRLINGSHHLFAGTYTGSLQNPFYSTFDLGLDILAP